MTPDASELGALIEPVALRLLGEPNHKCSTKTELRYGSRGSLAVDRGKGTFYDHEAEAGGGVLDLIERETGKTGEERIQWLVDERLLSNGHDRRPNGDGRKPRIVATYDYPDEDGVLLFQVCRYEPKDFRQRRPDQARPGEWIWKVEGVRQVPYRLPEITEALGLGKPVFIVEGERDVDRLWKIGIPATTNAGGAGKWRAELTKVFSGADVVIIPDNDPQKKHVKTGAPMFHPDGRPILPGQDHAEAVAAALSAVAKVRVLDLAKVWPDMPLKGDVSDWLDNGGSAKALFDLVDNLPTWSKRAGQWEPPPHDERNPPPIGEPNGDDPHPERAKKTPQAPSADVGGTRAETPHDKPLPKLVPVRFVEGEIPKPREWIVHDGWIPTRKVTLLQGDGGDGKTPLVQQLLSSCATALPWLGLRVEECTGLGFFTEDEDRDIRLRQADIDASYGQHCASTGKMHLFPRVDEDNELVVFDNRGKPSLTPFYRQVRESALDLRARLIALDIAVDLFGGDEISRRHVRGFMRPLGALAREIDGAVVMTAHVSQAGIKSDGGHSGSTDWSNGPRGRLYLGRPKAENGEATDPNARIFTRKKANFSTVGETVKLHWERGLIVPDNVTSSQFRRPIDDVFLALLDAITSEGQKVSAKPRAGNYAPAFFMRRPAKDRADYGRPDFERAMQGLLQRQMIKIVPYGARSWGYEKLVRADAGEGLS